MKKIKHRWSKFWLRVSTVPFEEASLEEWKNFAETAPRWLVEETAQKRFDAFSFSEYWLEVDTLLRKRCQTFDCPYIAQDFRQAHKNEICYVSMYDDGASILQAVKDAHLAYPFYVLATNGRFRGIAIADNLVVAGAINTNATITEERQIQEQNTTSSLSPEDVVQLVSVREKVSCMMQAVGLEPMKGLYWYCLSFRNMATLCIDGQPNVKSDEAFVIGKFYDYTKIETL